MRMELWLMPLMFLLVMLHGQDLIMQVMLN